MSANYHFSLSWFIKSAEYIEQCRLSRSGSSLKDCKLARRDLNIYSLERIEIFSASKPETSLYALGLYHDRSLFCFVIRTCISGRIKYIFCVIHIIIHRLILPKFKCLCYVHLLKYSSYNYETYNKHKYYHYRKLDRVVWIYRYRYSYIV